MRCRTGHGPHLNVSAPMSTLIHPNDTPALRKVRGAFFTPERVTDFRCTAGDLELVATVRSSLPVGDAAFMVAAVAFASRSCAGARAPNPRWTRRNSCSQRARVARERVRKAGGRPGAPKRPFDVVPELGLRRGHRNSPTSATRASREARANCGVPSFSLRGGSRPRDLPVRAGSLLPFTARYSEAGGRLGLCIVCV